MSGWQHLAAVLAAGAAFAAAAFAGAVEGSPGAVGTAASPRQVFTEEAAARGLDFVHFNGMSGELYFVEMNGAGAALFDYDHDGDLDIYLVQGAMLGPGKTSAGAALPAPLPPGDRLYRNELVPSGELRFTDVTGESGIDARGYGMGVATGDFDNDGWVDLYVTNFGSNQLWRNNGDGTFADVTAAAGVDDARWSVPAIFLDYDRDGWLDLYVGNYVDFTIAGHQTCPTVSGARDYCGPLAYHAESDRLFRNLGGDAGGPNQDGANRGGAAAGGRGPKTTAPGATVRFEDVSASTGLRAAPGAALGAVAGDFDLDGWPDLYVANDQMRNFMWMNPGASSGAGSFREEALMAGTAVNEEGQPEASMGVAAGDVDNDGDEDLFMTHITRETNTLYLNDGSGFFADATIAAELGAASWEYTGFGTGLFDYDNDGLLDLLVVNGAVRIIEALARDNDPHPLHQRNQLFHNLGGRFEEVSERSGAVFASSEVSRGAAFGDIDNDGDTDVLVTNNAGPVRLLINHVGQERHWLGLDLHGTAGDRPMLGARVGLRRPGRPTLWRRVGTGGSYASAGDPRVLFGLGEDPAVAAVEVWWPDGAAESWPIAAVDRYLTLRQGSGTALGGGGR